MLQQSDGGFVQDPPRLGNELLDDAFLSSLLRRLLPVDVLHDEHKDLGALSEGL